MSNTATAKIAISDRSPMTIVKLAYKHLSVRREMMRMRYVASGSPEAMSAFRASVLPLDADIAERAANAIHNAALEAAEKAAAPAPAPAVTCQVCGRQILANTGVIAHHGYTRPGTGWQTNSCPGARHLPYEVSCDVLPVVIAQATKYGADEDAYAERVTAEPPAEVRKVGRAGRRGEVTIEVLARPEGFTWPAYPSYRPGYETTLRAKIAEARENAKHARESVKFFQARLAAWVAPAAPKE